MNRLRRFGLVALPVLALAAGLGASLTAPAAADQPLRMERLANGAPMSFADLIEKVSPAVVSVNVTTEAPAASAHNFDFDDEELPEGFREFFREFERRYRDEAEPEEGQSLGSGFFISPDGYLVTNFHVIDNAKAVTVTLKDGEDYPARVIGSDRSTDLAVLKVDAEASVDYVSFAQQPVRVGDWVVAVGNPFGLGGTATAGIVSATEREIGGAYNDFIQVDAPINRGNSGGPTFDLAGGVIGVNSQIFSPSGGNVGIGFAIPASTAQKIVDILIKDGRVVRGWLGVQIQSLNEDMAEGLGLDSSDGAIVASVVDGSPADKAGFETGDVVLELDGAKIESAVDLTRKVGDLLVGETNRFRVMRDGKDVNIKVKIGERPGEEDLASLPADEDGGRGESGEFFGMSVSPLTDEDRERLGLKESDGGVVITQVKPRSEASSKGLETGEAVVQVGGREVTSVADVTAAIDAAREDGREAVLLAVTNGETRRFVALRFKEGG